MPPRPRVQKIEPAADLTSPFNVPEGASIADLTAMIEQVRADGLKLLDDPKAGSTQERVAKATWLSEAAAAMESRQDEIAQTDAAEQNALDTARAALAPKASDANPDDPNAPHEGDTGDAEGDDPDDPDGKAKDAQAAAQAGAPAPTTGEPQSGVPGEQLLVAGAGSRRSAVAAAASAGSASARRAPKPKGETAYLVAGAGSNDYSAGEKVDWEGMGRIAGQRFESLQGIGEGGPRVQMSMGKVKIPTADQRLVASASKSEFADVREQIEWAISMERLKLETGEDSLVAAGGWCSPSETLYDLVNLMTRDGLLDIPGITVTRGGVRFSLGPDFTAVYNAGANFTKTEAQAIAGSPKPIVNIPCPSFTDNRMNVDGLYLTGDILSQKGFPEAYADFLEKALIAFAHFQNAAKIADQVAGSTLIDYTASPPAGVSVSVTSTMLGTLELQVTDMRYKNRLSLTSMVEIVLPEFVKGILRSDMAKRLGVENTQGITDADIENFFAVRGASVQWVYDWQDAFTGVSGGFGAATAPKTWPTSINYLMYPQGTWVVAESDVIELQAVYDSTLLTTNQFVALFMERGRLSLKRAWDSRNIKIPVTVSGATALGIDYTSLQPTV